MKKSTKNLLIGLSAIAAVTISTTLITGRMLVKFAIHRNGIKMKIPKKLQSKVSGGLSEDPRLNIISESAKKARSLPTETVSITSSDGLRLSGHIYNCDEPQRIVLAMHGWRSNWYNDFGCSIDFLHNEGSLVLFPDQRGQNESDGDYIGFGVLERHDCLDWLKYIVDRFGTGLPIYLLGVSMGATTVLMASGLRLPDSVKGIIADCGFTSPHAIWAHILKNNLKIDDRLTYPIANAIIKKQAKFDGDEYSTIDALKVNTKPVLFIHGTDDKFVPISMTFDNYLACAAEKQMFIVPGAGHGMSYLVDTCGYQQAVRDFFNKCESNNN